ncbi:MAG: ribonuclease III [Microgenomates group bacterium]
MSYTLPQFKNSELLETALTHRSALNEVTSPSKESNERLEFLGDAVLELATTRYLFNQFPNEPEGVLTSYRSALVKTTTLAMVSEKLGLGDKLFMSKGEEATGGRTNSSLLADTMEAVIGALYLDQGYEATEQFLTTVLFTELEHILHQKLYVDAKSNLQEVVQALGFSTPVYEVTAESGPDHDKQFAVQVLVDGKAIGIGTGRSKQLAQQEAAKQALLQYDI